MYASTKAVHTSTYSLHISIYMEPQLLTELSLPRAQVGSDSGATGLAVTGAPVGNAVGVLVGRAVGVTVGRAVGALVGTAVRRERESDSVMSELSKPSHWWEHYCILCTSEVGAAAGKAKCMNGRVSSN